MKKNFLYSIPIHNKDKKENETSIYKHPLVIKKNWEDVYKKQTIHDNYKKLLENPNLELLGFRKKLKNGDLEKKFTWLKVREIFEKAEAIGSGILNLGLIEEINEWKNMNFKFGGIYAKNSINYFLSDIAMCIYGITIIPLYDTLGYEALEHAFLQTKMQTVFIETHLIKKMLSQKKEKNLYKTLKTVIILDEENFTKSLKKEIKKEFPDLIKIYTLSEIIEEGIKKIQAWSKINPDTIYSFSYTSGTTGKPKGVMLSHNNVCSACAASQFTLRAEKNDTYLSYLPMAHVMERSIFNDCLLFQVKIGVYNGDIKKLLEDMQILKPTFFISVPRVFNKIYYNIKKGLNKLTGFKKYLVQKAIKTKLENLKKNQKFTHLFYDYIIFSKIKKILGGKIRILSTGSAPINKKVLNFLKIAFCCPVMEGYGQTEGSSIQFATNEYDLKSGHVGGPVPCLEFKLVDVPEMNYYSTDKDKNNNLTPRGEIWVKGMCVCEGYYKMDKKNKETFENGWLKSGDIGCILSSYKNALQIIDRKKNIFKLSQGEYIAPEKLENIYKNCHNLITDIFVYGDSLKNYLVAAVNIQKNDIEKLALDFEIKFLKDEDLTLNKNLIDKILKLFLIKNKESDLNSLEKIKALIIDTVPWSENNLITKATLKKKRNDLKNYYLKDFEKLYKKLE